MKGNSSQLLCRFRHIAPKVGNETFTWDKICRWTKVAFSIVGYEPRNLEKSVIENLKNLGIDFPENSDFSEIDFTKNLEFSKIDFPKNLGNFFYGVWRVDA